MKRTNSLSNIQDANSTASSEQIDVVGDHNLASNYNFNPNKHLKTNFQGSFRSPIKLARQISSNVIATPNHHGQLTPSFRNNESEVNQLTPLNLTSGISQMQQQQQQVHPLQQTPTPTSLIKNCETEGIFNDLRRSANGFEARKALEAQNLLDAQNLIDAQNALLNQVRQLTPLNLRTSQINPFDFQNVSQNQVKVELPITSPITKQLNDITSPMPKISPVSEISNSNVVVANPEHQQTIVKSQPKQTTSNYSVKRGRKRIDESDSDAQEKRKKFLERNRKAAARCREKKKMWITDLETNAAKWSEENEFFKNENELLKQKLDFAKKAYKEDTGNELVFPDNL